MVFEGFNTKTKDTNISNQEESDNGLILPSMISSESEDSDES